MVKSKTIWILLGILVLILIIGLFWYGSQNQGVIKIGVITALTGELSFYGQGTLNAAKIAVEEINSKGGLDGKQIELITEDSPCKKETAITAVNKLVEIEKVNVILGPMCSGELLAIAPIVNDNKIVIMTSTATTPDIANAGDYVFRDVASDDLRAKVFADYLFKDRNASEIAIIYVNSDAGISFEDVFANKFELLGGKVIISEIFEKDSVDVRTQLSKIKEKNPGYILMISFPAETGTILKQAHEMGIAAQFFQGFEVMADPQISAMVGDLVNNVIYIQAPSQESVISKAFSESYKAHYGEEPPYYSAEAYDIIKLYAEAMKDGTDGETIKKNLYAIKNYEGASGIITFDEKGEVVKPFEIGQVQNMKLVKLKEV